MLFDAELKKAQTATQQQHLHHDSVRAVGLVQTNKAGCARGHRELTAGMHFWVEADLKPCFISTKGPLCRSERLLYCLSPTLLSSSHPPVVYDGHKVAGHECEFPGLGKVSRCLHLHRFSLQRTDRSEEGDTSFFLFVFFSEKSRAFKSFTWCFTPLPPSWWAGRSWACQKDCRPSTSSWPRTVLAGSPAVSPGARPPAPRATKSGLKRVTVRSVKNSESWRVIAKANRQQGRGRIPDMNTSTLFGTSFASRYLSARQTEPGLLTVGEHFPQGDSEHPHVRGVGEGADAEALRSTPRGERVASD